MGAPSRLKHLHEYNHSNCGDEAPQQGTTEDDINETQAEEAKHEGDQPRLKRERVRFEKQAVSVWSVNLQRDDGRDGQTQGVMTLRYLLSEVVAYLLHRLPEQETERSLRCHIQLSRCAQEGVDNSRNSSRKLGNVYCQSSYIKEDQLGILTKPVTGVSLASDEA